LSVKRRLGDPFSLKTAVIPLDRRDRWALQRRRCGDARADVAQQLEPAVELREVLREACDVETVGWLDNRPMQQKSQLTRSGDCLVEHDFQYQYPPTTLREADDDDVVGQHIWPACIPAGARKASRAHPVGHVANRPSAQAFDPQVRGGFPFQAF
jgi:hypothetical protein